MGSLNQAYKEFSNKGYNGIGSFISKTHSKENIIYDLLALHIDKIDYITSVIKEKVNSYNEFLELLVRFPDDIKFSKQLFKLRENPEMNLALLYGISAIKPIIIPLFKDHFILSENPEYFNSVWMTLVESWYTRVDVNNLSAEHMQDLSEETGKIAMKLNKHYSKKQMK
ncbi:MAG: hypothetical protein U9R60_05630 [Bacteroidota bacterium]|nr:hypothetical protein [Bacteroidota bacterium]